MPTAWRAGGCCSVADRAPVQAIIDALADVLRGVTVANGYRTDIGQHVHTERTESGIPSVPRCYVGPMSRQRRDREANGRDMQGMIEFTLPASYANAMATVIAADEDIDELLAQYHQMPDALPVRYEETVYLDRPDGMPVVAAQIFWSTGYRLK